jgi:hypothetical protein
MHNVSQTVESWLRLIRTDPAHDKRGPLGVIVLFDTVGVE